MKILGLIPARGGSKGVPRKNIRSLGGKPLIGWTIATALKLKEIDRLVVSTEDEEIAAVARLEGAEVPFLRPPELAGDTARSIDVIINVLEAFSKRGEHFDAVCLLQPTAPFRSERLLRTALKLFAAENFSGLISVSRVPDHYHPNWAFIAGPTGLLQPAQGEGSVIPRRQELPPAFIRDGAIYLTRTEVIMGGDLFGDRLGYVVNEDKRQVNIDTMADWETAEKLLEL